MYMGVGEVKLATSACNMDVMWKPRERGVSFPFHSGVASAMCWLSGAVWVGDGLVFMPRRSCACGIHLLHSLTIP